MLLGIVGKKGSGKSTLAKMLVEVCYPTDKVFIISLSDFIVEDLKQILGIEEIDIEKKRENPMFRALLQSWGTTRKELSGQSYWLDQVCLSMPGEGVDKYHFIVPSIRYQYEADWILANKGALVSITGRVEKTGVEEIDNHHSESEVSTITGISYTVENNKNMNWLKLEAKNIKELILCTPTPPSKK